MKLKNTFAVLLSAVMILGLLAACTNNSADTIEPVTPPTATEYTPNEDATTQQTADRIRPTPLDEIHGVDFDTAFDFFAPDTAMIHVGDFTVSWEELFFLIHGNIVTIVETLGTLPRFSDMAMMGHSTYEDSIMRFAVDNSLQFKAYEYGARELGITLTMNEVQVLETTVQEMILSAGGEQELINVLWRNSGIQSLDLFRYMLLVEFLPMNIFHGVFGANGETITDEQVAETFPVDEYLFAKHIILLNDTENPATPRTQLGELLTQLRNYTGDDLEGLFTELMVEHSQDHGGLAMFPNGYLFRDGDMEQPFTEAAKLLEIGEISEIIETTSGYHIIMRLPINFDVAPIGDALAGNPNSVRFNLALVKFDALLESWINDLPVEFTPEFESINLSEMFIWHD